MTSREKNDLNYRIAVVGASSGGFHAVKTILSALPPDFPLPVVVVQHIGYQADNFLVHYLDKECRIRVKEGEGRETLLPGVAYIAPPDYHLLVEEDLTLSLSSTEKVNYARPSIDVLFESAAYSLGNAVVGILLTGANSDGSRGIKAIRDYGGLTIVEDPDSAYSDIMPRAALKLTPVDYILKLETIGPFIKELFETKD